jgi:hypothetical protein
VQVSFEKREGAVLLLQQEAERQSIAADLLLRRYILRHAQEIEQFVASLSIRATMQDLIFVTGHVKTATWDTWTFRESSTDNSISFDVGAPGVASASVVYSRSYQATTSPAHAWGPQAHPVSVRPSTLMHEPSDSSTPSSSSHPLAIAPPGGEIAVDIAPSAVASSSAVGVRPLAFDQCLLVSGYKFKQRRFRIPERLRAAAGPDDLSGHKDEGEASASTSLDSDDDETDIALPVRAVVVTSRIRALLRL